MGKIARLPIRRSQFETGKFAAWLTENGAEIGRQTNPYEVIRYRAYSPGSRKALTHIVYSKDNGLLNFQGGSREHYQAFMDGVAPTGFRIPALDRKDQRVAGEPDSPTKSERRRAKLLERDGSDCWFCGIPMGSDITIEHLVPKSARGPDALANYALAHAVCNHAAADMPLVQKIELRAKMRLAASLARTEPSS